MGDQTAHDFADALDDEMRPVVLEPQLQLMLDRIIADMECRMWRIGFAFLAFSLTALGIATGLIIALN